MTPPSDETCEAGEARETGGVLTIDLAALADNYRLITRRAPAAHCAGVVKADGYGLGIEPIARTLWQAGCRVFFIATLAEGIALRALLPHAVLYVLNGLAPGHEEAFIAHGLRPVLGDLNQLAAWSALGRSQDAPLAAALHIDTGMNRLGLDEAQTRELAATPGLLDGVELTLIMSHLACADEPEHPQNARQLASFRAALDALPAAPASLANSAGVFLGPAYHFDMLRPGVALYGGNPQQKNPNPMAQVVHLQGRIIQVRRVDRGRAIGYGASHVMERPGWIATVSLGYADGYPRALGNRGYGVIAGVRARLVGRVSMDLITLDVTAAGPQAARPGALVDLIGGQAPLDDVARHAGTISYELLTGLSRRLARRYIGSGQAA